MRMSMTTIELVSALSLLTALGLHSPAAHSADIEVAVSGVRSADGQVKLMLFDRAEGFRKEDKARQVLAMPAMKGEIKGVFHDLPAGQYAILAYHDENGDGKLNLRLGMFPKEGYGLSNDPKIYGPPAFKDSAFQVPDSGTRMNIHLKY